VVRFLFVKSVEKLRACDLEHEHPLSRRIRMPTFPYPSDFECNLLTTVDLRDRGSGVVQHQWAMATA